jgi:hypothetical protein
MVTQATRTCHLFSHNPQPLISQNSPNPQICMPKTGCATSHNQTQRATTAEAKSQLELQALKLWCENPPQPQVNNKKIRQYNMKLQWQPTSKRRNFMHDPVATSFQLQLPLQQNLKSTLKTALSK